MIKFFFTSSAPKPSQSIREASDVSLLPAKPTARGAGEHGALQPPASQSFNVG